MSCCSRDKLKSINADQKWDYINLSDFRSTSCFTYFSYGILWISLLISISVYVVDSFTAVNILAYERWAGQVQPNVKIPFQATKWIFAGCIIFSFVLLAFEWIRALRVIKRDGVAESYLDPLAVRVQSIRLGKEGRGWRRFLVFAQLTKSRKGADYVALFAYFSFRSWLRVILAEGPRQVINAFTLYAFFTHYLLPTNKNAPTDGRSSFQQFWFNAGKLADSNQKQAVILCGMLWTLVIWVISVLNLIIALILYLLFLWHWVPSSDGTLGKYCKRKVDSRVSSIVEKTVQKARERDETKRQLADAKALKNGQKLSQIKREPTLPTIEILDGQKADDFPILSRQDTMSTLPAYSSRPPTGNDDERDPSRQPNRSDTNSPATLSRQDTRNTYESKGSYGSTASLMNNSGPMGRAAPARNPSPPTNYSANPNQNQNGYGSNGRSMTGSPFGYAQTYGPGPRPPTSQGRRTPGPPGSEGRRTPGPIQSGRSTPHQPGNGWNNQPRGPPPNGRGTPFQSYGPESNYRGPPYSSHPSTPASHSQFPQQGPPHLQQGRGNYNSQNRPLPRPPPPQRNMTDPGFNHFPPDPTPRSLTAPPQSVYAESTYNPSIFDAYIGDDNDLEMQRRPPYGSHLDLPPVPRAPRRAATAGPGPGGEGGGVHGGPGFM